MNVQLKRTLILCLTLLCLLSITVLGASAVTHGGVEYTDDAAAIEAGMKYSYVEDEVTYYVADVVAGVPLTDIVNTDGATDKTVTLDGTTYTVNTNVSVDDLAYALGARAFFGTYYADVADADAAAMATHPYRVNGTIATYVAAPVAGGTVVDLVNTDGATEKTVTVDGATYTINTNKTVEELAADFNAVAVVNGAYYTDLNAADAAAVAALLPYRVNGAIATYVAAPVAGGTVVDLVNTDGATDKTVTIDGVTYTVTTGLTADALAYSLGARAFFGTYYADVADADAAALAGGAAYRVDGDIATYVDAPVAGETVVDTSATGSTSSLSVTVDGSVYTVVTDKTADAIALAAGAVTRVGDVYFSGISSAISSLTQDNTSVYLLKDYTQTESLPKNTTVKSYTLTSENDAVLTVGCSWLFDLGKDATTVPTLEHIKIDVGAKNLGYFNGSTINIGNGAHIYGTGNSNGLIYGHDETANTKINVAAGATIQSNGTNPAFLMKAGLLTIDGGTFTGGAFITASGSTSVVINGGTFNLTTGSNVRGIYMSAATTSLTINDITLNASNASSNNVIRVDGAFEMNGGKITVTAVGNNPIRIKANAEINGGTFTYSAATNGFFYVAEAGSATFTGGTFTTTRGAMLLNGEQTSGKTIKVTVSGGDWTINNTLAKDAGGNVNLITHAVGELSITGGTFTATATKNDAIKLASTASITGGTFSNATGTAMLYVTSSVALPVSNATFTNTSGGFAQLDSNATVTVASGTYTNTTTGAMFIVADTATATFNGGTFNGGAFVESSGTSYIIINDGAAFNFTTGSGARAFFTKGAAASFTMNGGTITASNAASNNVGRLEGPTTIAGGTITVTAANNNPFRFSAATTISGGTFTNGTGNAMFYIVGATVNVTGGNYAANGTGGIFQLGEAAGKLNISGGTLVQYGNGNMIHYANSSTVYVSGTATFIHEGGAVHHIFNRAGGAVMVEGEGVKLIARGNNIIFENGYQDKITGFNDNNKLIVRGAYLSTARADGIIIRDDVGAGYVDFSNITLDSDAIAKNLHGDEDLGGSSVVYYFVARSGVAKTVTIPATANTAEVTKTVYTGYYTTLNAAIYAVTEADTTVYLIRDYTATESIKSYKNVTGAVAVNFTLSAANNAVLTVGCSYLFDLGQSSTVTPTIKDIEIVVPSGRNIGYFNDADLIVDSGAYIHGQGKVASEGLILGYSKAHIVIKDGAKLVAENTNYSLIAVKDGSHLDIQGGTLIHTGTISCADAYAMFYYYTSSKIEVTGNAAIVMDTKNTGAGVGHIFYRFNGAMKIDGENVILAAYNNNIIFENGYQDKITGFCDNNKLYIRGAYLYTDRADGVIIRDDTSAGYLDLANVSIDNDALAGKLKGDEDLTGNTLVPYIVARGGDVTKSITIPATANSDAVTKTVYCGYYTNLSDAVKVVAAETANVYVLNDGTAARSAMTITGNVTIYLGGYTITAAEANAVLFDVKAGATLTVLNGTITASNRFAYVYGTVNLGDAEGTTGALTITDPGKITTYMFEVIGAGNLNIYKNATLKTTAEASVGAANYIQMVSTFTGAVNVYGTVELNHAVTGNYKMFRFNSGGTATGALNVYDGAVLTYNCVPSAASNEHAVFYNYDQANASFNIYGGTIKNTAGKGVIFFLYKGIVNIEGGNLESNGSYGIYAYGSPTINISGGTFNSKGASSINVYTKDTANVSVTGGTFIAESTVNNTYNVYFNQSTALTIKDATFIHNGTGSNLAITNSGNDVYIKGNTTITHNGTASTSNIALNRGGGKYVRVDGADANLVISAPNGAYLLRTAYYVTLSNLTLNGTTATMGSVGGEDTYMVFDNVTIPSVELGESWLANVIVSCDGKHVAFSDATKAFTFANTLGAKEITVSLGKNTKVNRGNITFTTGAHITIDGRGHKMEVNGSNSTYLFKVQEGRTMTLKNLQVWNCPSKFAEVSGNLYITEGSSIIATASTTVTETTPMLLIWGAGHITLDAGCTIATEYTGGTAIDGEPNLSGNIESYYLIQSGSAWNGSMTINGTLRQGWNAAGQWSAVFRFNGGTTGIVNIGATAVLENNAAAGCAGGNGLIISDATITLNVADGATFTCPNYSIFRITAGTFTVNSGTFTNNRSGALFDVNGSGALVVKGGTYNGGNFIVTGGSSSKVTVDGGTFNLTTASTRAIWTGGSTTTVINGGTFSCAISNSSNVIRLDGPSTINDVTVNVTAVGNNPIRIKGTTVVNGGTYTYSAAVNGFFYVAEVGNATFNDGTFTTTRGAMLLTGEQTSGKTIYVTINGGDWTINNTLAKADGGNVNLINHNCTGVMSITGGTFNATATTNNVIRVVGKATITGGTFNSNVASLFFYITSNAVVEFNGVNYSVSNESNVGGLVYADTSAVVYVIDSTISNGSFYCGGSAMTYLINSVYPKAGGANVYVDAASDAKGRVVKLPASASKSVTLPNGSTVTVTNHLYADLGEAVLKATNANNTIILYKNYTQTASIAKNNNITGYTLTSENGAVLTVGCSYLFDLGANATVVPTITNIEIVIPSGRNLGYFNGVTIIIDTGAYIHGQGMNASSGLILAHSKAHIVIKDGAKLVAENTNFSLIAVKDTSHLDIQGGTLIHTGPNTASGTYAMFYYYTAAKVEVTGNAAIIMDSKSSNGAVGHIFYRMNGAVKIDGENVVIAAYNNNIIFENGYQDKITGFNDSNKLIVHGAYLYTDRADGIIIRDDASMDYLDMKNITIDNDALAVKIKGDEDLKGDAKYIYDYFAFRTSSAKKQVTIPATPNTAARTVTAQCGYVIIDNAIKELTTDDVVFILGADYTRKAAFSKSTNNKSYTITSENGAVLTVGTSWLFDIGANKTNNATLKNITVNVGTNNLGYFSNTGGIVIDEGTYIYGTGNANGLILGIGGNAHIVVNAGAQIDALGTNPIFRIKDNSGLSAKLTINGGTFNGGAFFTSTENTVVTVNGGTFNMNGSASGVRGFYASGASTKVVINDMTFTASNASSSNVIRADGTFTMNGGTITVNAAKNNPIRFSGEATVNGGTFINNTGYGYFYVCEDAIVNFAGGNYSYTAGHMVQNGEQTSGKTIKITVSGGNWSVNGATSEMFKHSVGELTITGGTFNGGNFVVTSSSPTLNINGGTFNLTTASTRAIWTGASTTLTINGGTFNCAISNSSNVIRIDGPATINDVTVNVTAVGNNPIRIKGTTVVNGGTFTYSAATNGFFYVAEAGNATFNGGTFTTTAGALLLTGEQTSGKTVQITVSGGNWSVSGTTNEMFKHTVGVLTISGGTIDGQNVVKATGSTKTVVSGNAVINFNGQSSSERAFYINGTSTQFEMHGGTINATNAKSSNVIRAEGAVKFTGGTIDVKAAGNNPVRISATAVIDGGTFKNATAQQFFYLAQEANVTINGGNFLSTYGAMLYNGEQTDGKTIKVTINGGYWEINNTLPKASGGNMNLITHAVGEMSITGGTFNAISTSNNAIKLAAKASVTGGTYANTTSSLMLYVTSGVALNVSNVIFNGTSGFAYVDGKANVTVANGSFRSVDDTFTVKSDSTVTVNGGSFNGALATVEGGKLVVNAGSFISNADKAIITASSGSLALNAGSFEQAGKKSNASILSFTGSGSVTATLKGTSLVLRSTMPAIRSTNAAATVTIDGISFVSYAKLYEGTFADFNVTSLALASDSVARMNGAIVRLNDKRVGNGGLATNFKTGYYFDLASALEAAKDGDTLYLLNSFELAPNEFRVTAKAITLVGATDGIVITAKDASDYLIYVVDGGSLTLENVTVFANGNGIGIRATADASAPSVFTLGANAKLYGERIDAQSLIYVYGGKYATVNVYGTVGFGKNDGSAELLGCNANPYVIRSASGFEGTITVTGTVYNLLTKKTPDWHHLFRMEGATGTLVLDGATLIHQLAPHAEYTTTNAIVWNDGITIMKDSTFITNTNAFYNSVGTPLVKVENCDFSQVKTAIKATAGNAGCDFMDDMSAAALGYGFRIGETYYKTIADAIKALPKVDAETYASVTIYVTGGATTGTGTIDGNYDITLKGTYEGATLTETGGTFLTLKNGASLTVEDINFATNGALFNYTAGERNGSFVIRNSKITGAGTMSGSLIVVAGKANVVIGEDVLFDTTGATASAQVQLFEAGASFEGTADIYADFIHGASGAYNHKIIRSSSTTDGVINIHESATLTYNCPDVAASDEAAVIYNYAASTSTVINVRGAKIAHNVANGAISYICNGATLNVYDATLTSVAKSFVVKANGNVNVYGGDFTMAGESAFTNAGFVTIYGGSFHLANEEASIVVDAAGGSSNMLSYVANGVSSANGIVAAGVTPVVKDGELKLLFTATLTSSAYADLKALADEGEVTFGMLLVPAAALNGTSFNHKALAGSDFVDVVAEGDALTVAANGNATIAIEQGGLDAATEYAAIFYAKYSVNGATVYTYSGYTAEDNNADLVSVATAALADVSATPDSTYCYKVAEGVFSRYDRAACEILAKYVAK